MVLRGCCKDYSKIIGVIYFVHSENTVPMLCGNVLALSYKKDRCWLVCKAELFIWMLCKFMCTWTNKNGANNICGWPWMRGVFFSKPFICAKHIEGFLRPAERKETRCCQLPVEIATGDILRLAVVCSLCWPQNGSGHDWNKVPDVFRAPVSPQPADFIIHGVF